MEKSNDLALKGMEGAVNFGVRRPGSLIFFDFITYIYMSFAFGLNAVILTRQDDGSGAGKDNFTFSITWVALHLAIIFIALVLSTNRKFFRFGRSEIVMIISAFYVSVSALWAPSPASSIPYALMTSGNIIFAYMCSRIYPPNDFLIIIRRILLCMIFSSIIAFLSGYKNVIYYDPHDRFNIFGMPPLRGFFPHKIMASLYAAICCAICLCMTNGVKKLIYFTVSISFILLTGSSTGIVIFASCLLLYYFLAFAKLVNMPSSIAVFGVFIVVISGSFISYNYFSDILNFLGRDPTLTGRTLLWGWGISAWLQKPIFGWGFKGYFDSVESKNLPGELIVFRNYDVPHFHQSFIQTAVDLGLIGVSIAFLSICVIISVSYRSSVVLKARSATAVFLIISIFVVASTSMFVFINYNHPVTILLFYFMFYCLINKFIADPE